MASTSRQQLEAYLRTLEIKADKVLDIGGAQLPMPKRVKSWEVGEYRILDLENPHEGNIIPDYICDLNEDDQLIKFISHHYHQFDCIFAIEISEYLIDPRIVIQGFHSVLKKGGKLYMSFQFVYPMHSPAGKDYFRYTKWGAEELLRRAGFEVTKCVPRVAENVDLLSFYRAEEMRFNKHYTGHNETGYMFECIKS